MELTKPDLSTGPDQANDPAIAAALSTQSAPLTGAEPDANLAFFGSFEEPVAMAGGRMPVPRSVSSGLPLDD